MRTWAGFAKNEEVAKTAPAFTVAPQVLAIRGDIEYGAYLASGCITCHQPGGNTDGIPPIAGLEAGIFVTALHAYRQKHRDNPVMQLVAGRLTDDEIAALAAYFETLGK
ncbi:MAG: c-type cytochrome [Rhodobacteraceae bacterium]|nr:c-type cytochrome [Paracoccaceae bacterium]